MNKKGQAGNVILIAVIALVVLGGLTWLVLSVAKPASVLTPVTYNGEVKSKWVDESYRTEGTIINDTILDITNLTQYQSAYMTFVTQIDSPVANIEITAKKGTTDPDAKFVSLKIVETDPANVVKDFTTNDVRDTEVRADITQSFTNSVDVYVEGQLENMGAAPLATGDDVGSIQIRAKQADRDHDETTLQIIN